MIDIYHFQESSKFDENTNTLYYERNCGIGSNFSVLVHLLLFLKVCKKIYPTKIVMNLTDYKGLDLYKNIFYINKDKLEEWKSFDWKRAEQFLIRTQPNGWGLGSSKKDIDLDATNLIIQTFFNLYESVLAEEESIIKKYNIDKDNFNFIYWRRTDKIFDVHNSIYPDVEDGLKLFDSFENLIGQTDDPIVVDEFKKHQQIKILNVLPVSPVERMGYHYYCQRITDKEHIEKYGYSIDDHAKKLLGIVKLASSAKKFVGYPGNLSFMIALFRNNFNNFKFFYDKNIFYA